MRSRGHCARTKVAAIAAALALLPVRAGHAVQPTSSIRVAVVSVGVTGLSCSRRKFKMAYTKNVTARYSHMASGMFTKDLDPRPLALGLAACIILIPMTVLAVPSDLITGPFRRECGFEAHMEAGLVDWTGKTVPGVDVTAEGLNLLRPASPGVSNPIFFRSETRTVSDEDGRFSLSIAGHVGRSPDFAVLWKVKGLPSGGARFRKKGDRFLFEEQPTGLAGSVFPPPPLVIKPKMALDLD